MTNHKCLLGWAYDVIQDLKCKQGRQECHDPRDTNSLLYEIEKALKEEEKTNG